MINEFTPVETYNIKGKSVLVKRDDLEKADAVILAVPHNDFISQGWKIVSEALNIDGGIVYDIKSILDRNKKPDNVNLIRL